MNKRAEGSRYEHAACSYLKERGFQIAEQNFRCRQGEVDIIGYHGGYLVFVEVKYRATPNQGRAEEAVTVAKQRRICRTADYYRYRHGMGEDCPVRYDVIAIQGKMPDMVSECLSPHLSEINA